MPGSHALSFSILHRDTTSRARLGRVNTPHGSFDTPAFMPVGTKASLKGLTIDHILSTGSQVLLNNAFHLMLRPGDDLIARVFGPEGVHRFMQWQGPILTDSGGYQAFSLSHINDIDDDGVIFKSIIDGAPVHLGPERSMEVQNNLGADIIMAFDDCPPAPAARAIHRGVAAEDSNDDHHDDDLADEPAREPLFDPSRRLSGEYRARVALANERTIRWLERCVKAHRRAHDQALFGIVQGGTDLHLRSQSSEQVCAIELPGYAIGGVAVGEGTQAIHTVVNHTAPLLPDDKPRYLMGVGYESDILAAVQAGVDMFDCVLPTRNGRNGNAFTRNGRLHLRNALHAENDEPIDRNCDCLACSGVKGQAGGYSRAYLRHLFQANEMLGPILVSLHNVRHFQRLLLDIRTAIREDGWSSFHRTWPVAGSGRKTP
jgi:queuine tRNA-ribosyltransferase